MERPASSLISSQLDRPHHGLLGGEQKGLASLRQTPPVAPGQHMQLQQDRCREPSIPCDLVDKPSEVPHQIVDGGLVAARTRVGGQRCRIPDLQINRKSRIAVRHKPGIGVVIAIKHS